MRLGMIRQDAIDSLKSKTYIGVFRSLSRIWDIECFEKNTHYNYFQKKFNLRFLTEF